MGRDRKELTQRYFTSVANNYAQQSEKGWWGWLREKESSAVLSALELNSHTRCLELGCGAGYYGKKITALTSSYLGVDRNLAMAEAARSSGLEAVCEGWEIFNAAPQFDRILAAGVIEFTDCPGELLKKIQSLLSPEGLAVVLYPPAGFFGFSYRLWHQIRECPVNIVETEAWPNLLDAAGLELVSLQRVTPISNLMKIRKTSSAKAK